MRFLVIDDSAIVRRIVISVLEDLGYQSCYEAASGQAALAVLATTTIDFVITDWKLTGMSGLDLLRVLRAREETRDLPALVLTSVGGVDRPSVQWMGIVGVVSKPFTADALSDAVVLALAQFPGRFRTPGRRPDPL